MKAVLNVDGKKLEVASISYVNGEVRNVQVHLGNHEYKSYEHHETLFFNDAHLLINFNETLEFPELEERIVDEQNEIIKRLEKIIAQERQDLTNIAIDAMEGEADGLPFSELPLSDAQKEYKLAKQYLLGVVDAAEAVKAYTDGYYADKNNDGPIE